MNQNSFFIKISVKYEGFLTVFSRFAIWFFLTAFYETDYWRDQ